MNEKEKQKIKDYVLENYKLNDEQIDFLRKNPKEIDFVIEMLKKHLNELKEDKDVIMKKGIFLMKIFFSSSLFLFCYKLFFKPTGFFWLVYAITLVWQTLETMYSFLVPAFYERSITGNADEIFNICEFLKKKSEFKRKITYIEDLNYSVLWNRKVNLLISGYIKNCAISCGILLILTMFII